MASLSTIAPGYSRDYDVNRTSVSLVRPSHHHHSPPAVIEEPVIEHEHHHLHHHIDHGDVNSRLAMTRARPNLGREYSFDDLDIRERRYPGGSVTTISTEHDHSSRSRTRRHRHRHRSRRGSEERTHISREFDERDYDRDDDLTVIDVPAGTRRVYVNVEKSRNAGSEYMPSSPIPAPSVDWRRERGVRRSRGLGNELWTEITKDLVTREAIEELGYQFEETEYFYYIFEFLDKEQIAELRELTDIIRHERVHDMQYESIASSSQLSLDRGLSRGPRSMRDERFEPRMLEDNDSRTEIIIESGHRDRQKRYRRYHY